MAFSEPSHGICIDHSRIAAIELCIKRRLYWMGENRSSVNLCTVGLYYIKLLRFNIADIWTLKTSKWVTTTWFRPLSLNSSVNRSPVAPFVKATTICLCLPSLTTSFTHVRQALRYPFQPLQNIIFSSPFELLLLDSLYKKIIIGTGIFIMTRCKAGLLFSGASAVLASA